MTPNIQFPTQNYMVPSAGTTHAASFRDVLGANPLLYDFSQFEIDNYRFSPQGAWIDNSANASQVTLTIEALGMSIIIPAYSIWAGNFPAPKDLRITATGSGTVPITFVDFPVLPQLFYAQTANGQPVSVPANPFGSPAYLEQLIPATNFAAQAGTASAAGATNIAGTPASANLRKLVLDLSGDATMAAAGENVITVSLNGVQIWQATINITAASVDGSKWFKTLDFDTIAPNSGNGALSVTLGTALTAGKLSVNAYYD